ncbi:hypothetical protein NZ698_14465 [Chryseobacterium sp. PBS4-4]|uniref:DUF3997 domain-containing protein n=1 Tax=Chryseobacterium edaphi TaxID=2976532 RepID=A0ABT2W860_9FLAO|nr:hypothetical protein [Chryseobacterium edaphi]MCU7618401.1 hypothetical protein [Chryseobacterium edaphi]
MKFILLLITILALTNCSSDHNSKFKSIDEGFIETTGTYLWGRTQKTIVVKKIENSCKIFAIIDKKGKVLYQQPMNVAFSDYHYWLCYVDDKENLYYYNSDYDEPKALIWNQELQKYDEKNFCSNKISLPKKFKTELSSKETLIDCLSLK